MLHAREKHSDHRSIDVAGGERRNWRNGPRRRGKTAFDHDVELPMTRCDVHNRNIAPTDGALGVLAEESERELATASPSPVDCTQVRAWGCLQNKVI